MNYDFNNAVKGLGIELSDRQIDQFELYYKLLIEWNHKMNLTAIKEKDEVYEKHFYDSLCLTKAVTLENQHILDVGSGAGFPSIPLKIMFPQLEVTIVDSLKKRIDFLTILADKLDIKINLHHARIETFELKGIFDIVTARAVAPLNILSELCIPFVAINGLFIAMKSKSLESELSLSKNAIEALGGVVKDTVFYSYSGNERSLIVVKKQKQTDSRYPRKYNKIKKTPL